MAVHRTAEQGRARAPKQRLLTRVSIRPARFGDAQAIAGMANDLARRTIGGAGRMTAAAVRRDLIGQPDLGCLVADRSGSPIGYALWSAAYETAFAARGVYLSDLYVSPEHRSRGVGRGLMRALARICQEQGGRFLWWAVTPDNAEAQAFYDNLGAVSDPVEARALFEAPFEALLQD